MSVTVRRKVIEWEDPLELAARVREMSGIDALRAIQSGELPPPPIALLMGMGPGLVEPGRVIFDAEPDETHFNPIGTVHGGWAATLLDTVMGCAVQTLCPPSVGYTSLELKINFVRPLLAGAGPQTAEGVVLHPGKRVATAEGRIHDADGRLIAHGTTTCLILG